MKKIIIALTLVIGVQAMADAQHVRVRMNFPVNISIGAPDPSPYRGAIWVGPEWRWQRGEYMCVPGYWSRPQRHRVYRGGYWRHGRGGYVWVPGRWR